MNRKIMAVAKARMDTARTVMVVICSRPRYIKSGRKELRAVPMRNST